MQGLPVSIAFTSIMFRDSLYAAYIPALARLVVLANGIHQLVFVAVATIPFGVGQVQDVGLIFLSAMTTSVAKLAREREGYSDAVVVSTALVAISMSTAIVGLLLMVVGRCAFSSSNRAFSLCNRRGTRLCFCLVVSCCLFRVRMWASCFCQR